MYCSRGWIGNYFGYIKYYIIRITIHEGKMFSMRKQSRKFTFFLEIGQLHTQPWSLLCSSPSKPPQYAKPRGICTDQDCTGHEGCFVCL